MELPDNAERLATRIDSVDTLVKTEIPGICARCTQSHIYQTRRMSEPIVICTALSYNYRMPVDVSECNQFKQIGQLSIWELAKLAIDVDLTERHKPGFHNE